MYTTFLDSPTELEASEVDVKLYTSAHSYTLSDHVCPTVILLLFPAVLNNAQKPVVALLSIPTNTLSASNDAISTNTLSVLQLPSLPALKPDPWYTWKRVFGQMCNRTIGYGWTLLWLLGLGNTALGIGNVVLGLLAWSWMRWRPSVDE